MRSLWVLLVLATWVEPVWATSLSACLKALEQQAPAVVAAQFAERLQDDLPRARRFWTHYCIGRAWKTAGDFRRAETPLRAALALADTAFERQSAQSYLGTVLGNLDRLEEAEAAHQAALVASRENGNPQEEASELNNLATIAKRRGNYTQALDLLARCLALDPKEKHKAVVFNNLANVHDLQGAHAQAVEARSRAIAIARRLDDRRNLAIYLLAQGNSYRLLKQWSESVVILDEGLALARANGDRFGQALGLMYRGWMMLDSDQKDAAYEYLDTALGWFEEIGAAEYVGEIRRILARP